VRKPFDLEGLITLLKTLLAERQTRHLPARLWRCAGGIYDVSVLTACLLAVMLHQTPRRRTAEELMLTHEVITGAMIAALVGVSLSLSLGVMSMLRALVAIMFITTLLVAVDAATGGSLTRRVVTLLRAIGYELPS